MKKQLPIRRSRFAQNRIAYIIYSNPDGAKKLLDQFGFESPENIHHRVKAVKELVRRKGRKAIQEVIRLHPDQKAILKVNESARCPACNSPMDSGEDHYCGSCGYHQYTGEEAEAFVNQLVDMNMGELETRFQQALNKAQAEPENTTLAEEVQLIWNELKQRVAADNQESSPEERELLPSSFVSKQGIMVLGLTLLTGVVVGASIK